MSAELMTETEHRVVEMMGEVWNLICTEVIGHGPSREGDLEEIIHHIHAIQRTMMKQAAARAYPNRYRLLGGIVG